MTRCVKSWKKKLFQGRCPPLYVLKGIDSIIDVVFTMDNDCASEVELTSCTLRALSSWLLESNSQVNKELMDCALEAVIRANRMIAQNAYLATKKKLNRTAIHNDVIWILCLLWGRQPFFRRAWVTMVLRKETSALDIAPRTFGSIESAFKHGIDMALATEGQAPNSSPASSRIEQKLRYDDKLLREEAVGATRWIGAAIYLLEQISIDTGKIRPTPPDMRPRGLIIGESSRLLPFATINSCLFQSEKWGFERRLSNLLQASRDSSSLEVTLGLIPKLEEAKVIDQLDAASLFLIAFHVSSASIKVLGCAYQSLLSSLVSSSSHELKGAGFLLLYRLTEKRPDFARTLSDCFQAGLQGESRTVQVFVIAVCFIF
mmetsp:Transcript_19515/g.49987  ORF Transcript_19515/g.49987 Transcript_19515/m.49987 type:complete len:374 (-) Transcript_19515:960-2081(-)